MKNYDYFYYSETDYLSRPRCRFMLVNGWVLTRCGTQNYVLNNRVGYQSNLFERFLPASPSKLNLRLMTISFLLDGRQLEG